jgi:HPt (histidine-containing phosphotransfer) domain-containing protein
MIFNVEEALARCMGQQQMLLEMIDYFSGESGAVLPAIRASTSEHDAAAMGRAAHRLKGTLIYLGAQPAIEAAQDLEQMGLNNDLTGADRAVERLAHEVELLRQALAPYRAEAGSKESDHGRA